MRRSLHAQVEGLYQACAKGIGIKRHGMKLAGKKDTVIHSDNTRKAYLRVWHSIVKFAKERRGLTSIDELNANDVNSWFLVQVRKGLAPLTIAQYRSAIIKLEQALYALRERKGGGHV
ncbi:site-specific integrase [Geomonas paludis]|uniref:Site-specific integrase n=1 Tax=Geomonas paludis TaxID=2740185 RepID=A0A6V8N056_9BACT|nr:site-specific integrase [Geomonas paludis]UPU36633.1 site-specific integrase [Geomonas paludis]GFO65896.1 hypothetical protein GMPD_38150 [Geomonas paludis]